jgi:hypothetical protein
MEEFKKNTKAGDRVEVVVARKGEDGKEVKTKLTAPALLVEGDKKLTVTPLANPTPQQLAMRDAWLKP